MEAKRSVGRPRCEEAIVSEILALKDQGYTYMEISSKLLVGKDTIRRKLREAGKYYGRGNYDRSRLRMERNNG